MSLGDIISKKAQKYEKMSDVYDAVYSRYIWWC